MKFTTAAAALALLVLSACSTLELRSETEKIVPRVQARSSTDGGPVLVSAAVNLSGGYVYAQGTATAGVFYRTDLGDFNLSKPLAETHAELLVWDWTVEPTRSYRHPLMYDAAGMLVGPVPDAWRPVLLRYDSAAFLEAPVPAGLGMHWAPPEVDLEDAPPAE